MGKNCIISIGKALINSKKNLKITHSPEIIKLLLLMTIQVALHLPAESQNFEQLKKQQQERMEAIRRENAGKLDQLRREFTQYQEKRNLAFAAYVKNAWAEFHVLKGLEPPALPKPDTIPPYTPAPSGRQLPMIEPVDITPDNPDFRLPELYFMPQDPVIPAAETYTVVFEFYGQILEIETDKKLESAKLESVSEKGVAAIWELLTAADYASVVRQLFNIRETLNLNDWGYYLLCRQYAAMTARFDQGTELSLTWALLNHSGYKARIGIGNNRIYLLLPTIQPMYGTSYLVFDNLHYHIPEHESGTIRTYDQNFDGAYLLFDLSIYKALHLPGETVHTEVETTPGKSIRIPVSKNLISFYKDIPLTDFEVYFNAPMDPQMKEALAEAFHPELEAMEQSEKLQFLLRWVQTAFHYKTDKEQFGREKFFFAEELFFYPFSDCEDRSVLFARMVRLLLNLDVIGIQYPGHMATAVWIPEETAESHILYNEKNYTICDPTYRNAPVGITMPEYMAMKPAVVPVKNPDAPELPAARIWETITLAGGAKTSRQHSVSDNQGNHFVAGTFSGSLTLDDHTITGSQDASDIFIASFGRGEKVNWLVKLDNGPTDLCNGITMKDNTLYISGLSTTQSLNEIQITVRATDRMTGKAIWEAKEQLTLLPDTALSKTYLVSMEGQISQEEAPALNDAFVYGISVLENNLIVRFHIPGMTAMMHPGVVVETGSDFDLNNDLRSEYQKIISKKYDPYAAGLIAVFNLIQKSGSMISGSAISNILNENRQLAARNPEIVTNLKRVLYFKNDNGRIIMKTTNNKPVSFYNLHFTDNSSVKIVGYQTEKTMVECLSGVSVGKAFISFTLNSMLIDHFKGDILFDYGSDHSKKVLNLKKDILEI